MFPSSWKKHWQKDSKLRHVGEHKTLSWRRRATRPSTGACSIPFKALRCVISLVNAVSPQGLQLPTPDLEASPAQGNPKQAPSKSARLLLALYVKLRPVLGSTTRLAGSLELHQLCPQPTSQTSLVGRVQHLGLCGSLVVTMPQGGTGVRKGAPL